MKSNNLTAFELTAESEPGTLPRILEYFALNSTTPSTVWARRNDDGSQKIYIEVEGLSDQRAYIIASKLAGIFTVNSATYVQNPVAELDGKSLKCA
ncbi:hypothetical protein [Kiloniella sp.]|uniref:hypothetical protein n=1 Tax=Kiloniella sp. TaxID=1938587 RepID=UPI003B010AE2